ncbi:hypothetical protein IAU59_002219 [Kwoniella sp. CBS 9459]
MGAVEDAKELGTLIVVVGKAKNLVNKSRFGKQDPFCTVLVGEEKQRTKPIKRGGQHPEWDEELRFTIVEDLDDVLVRSESQPDSLNSSLNGNGNGGAPAPLPKDTPAGVITSAALASKSRKGPLGKKGGKSMKVACYADDAKEPELIGECVVPIDEVLKKGEVDEWYEFLYKDKYSGEVYLELTFYSNDAPPIRRNVPRPAVHGYASGVGQLNPSPSGSLSSAASKNKLAGNLAASGSVSGMSLYIPPYMQPGGRAPSPTPNPQVAPSNSFAELGLPPGHHSAQQIFQLQPGQPAYPPAQQPVAPPLLSTQSSIDALTRPMSSMSLGQSYPARPLAATPAPQHPQPPQQQQQQQQTNHIPAHGAHRHSLGGPSDAPWAQMLPQAQPPPAPTPHPRPMSTSDAIPWEQAQRMEQERLPITATPLPRPGSEQGYGNPLHHQQQQQYTHHHRQSFSGIDHRVPSPIPESLRPAAPPEAMNHLPPRSQSFSQATPAPIPAPYPALSPAPIPPPHSNSAPPISPNSSNNYHMPSHSFSALTQPVVDNSRTASPGPVFYQPQQQQHQQPYNGGYQETHAGPSAQPPYNAVDRRDTYPPRPQEYQQTPPPPPPPPTAQSYASSYGQMPPSSSQYNSSYTQSESQYVQTTAVPPQQAPSLQPAQPPANSNGYVPWYQQTQSTTPVPSAPPPQPIYGQQQYTQSPYPQISPSTSQYSSPGPPPVPQARPQPIPPSRPQGVGYYPSDELYVAQRQESQTPTPQPPSQAPWQAHQSRPSYDQQASYDSQRQQTYTPVPTSSYTPGLNQPSYQHAVPQAPSPPRQPSWQQTQPQYPSSSSTPQPFSPPFPSQPIAYAQTSSTVGQPPTMNDRDFRATSPHPQQGDYGRAPSPQPPTHDYYGQQPHQQHQQQQQSPYQSASYGRAPSPQPMSQPQSYQPPYPNQTPLPPSQSQAQLVPPAHSTSPHPSSDPGRAPSPSMSSTSNAKKDWRSYMAGLSTTPNGGIVPNRTPSPQPPPKDPQQGQWYTPPPSLPNSIVPPEGWRSTLPAQKDGHHWRG